MNDLISVIVPIYNGQKYLYQCIDSILNQDYSCLEVILVDDGSKDNSGEIIEKYAARDRRVCALHQKNAGVSLARNNGLRHSHGRYVCFIDQDDFIKTDYISYFYHLIRKNDADIAVTPNVERVTRLNQKWEGDNVEEYVEVWSGYKAAEEMLYYNLVIAPWNKMIKKSLIMDHELIFDQRFFSGEGFLFSLECYINAKRVVVGNQKKYCYRVDNPNSGMTKFNTSIIISSIDAQTVIKEKIGSKSAELLKACKYANWHTHCDCLNMMVGCGVQKKYSELYKRMKTISHRDALGVFSAHVEIKEKIKGFCYFLSPYMTSIIINHFRIRKFTKDNEI